MVEGERNSQRRHEKEMKGELRENLKSFFWLLKWGIFWTLILLIFGVPFF
jgi:hypothetical protein